MDGRENNEQLIYCLYIVLFVKKTEKNFKKYIDNGIALMYNQRC